MKKIIFIGAIDKDHLATNGETMKNQLLLRRFEDIYDEVIAVDTNLWQKRPWCLFQILFALIWNNGVPVIISASDSSRWLFNFLYYIPLKKNVNDWVIGGALPKKIRNGQFRLKSLKKLNRIIVESQGMANELNSMGLNNVVHVPNFKPINYHPIIVSKDKNALCRFVFLSRIHPHKGITDIVNACQQLNNSGYKEKFIIDFYGPFELGYEPEFNSLIVTCNNIQYRGFLNMTNNEGYDILSQYDAMLFPTYWENEGFPGVIIDAYIAGLPIIASDWNINKEVIIDGKTGFIIPAHDSSALTNKMKDIIDGHFDLYKMRTNCAAVAKQYDYRNVVTRNLLQSLQIL